MVISTFKLSRKLRGEPKRTLRRCSQYITVLAAGLLGAVFLLGQPLFYMSKTGKNLKESYSFSLYEAKIIKSLRNLVD